MNRKREKKHFHINIRIGNYPNYQESCPNVCVGQLSWFMKETQQQTLLKTNVDRTDLRFGSHSHSRAENTCA